jgi:hypothetical protein
MAKNRTRFYFEMSSGEIEILSVKENYDRSLTVLSKNLKFFEHTPGVFEELRSQHYSIHKSNAGRDVTITQKTDLFNGKSISICTFIHDCSDVLLWPVTSRRLGSSASLILKRPLKKSEEAVRIAQIYGKTFTLFYSVFVTRPNFDGNYLKTQYESSLCYDFSDFSIVVIWSILMVPPLPVGDVRVKSTSYEMVNGHYSGENTRISAGSLPYISILDVHWDLMVGLRRRLVERLVEAIGDEVHRKVEVTVSFFFPYPVDMVNIYFGIVIVDFEIWQRVSSYDVQIYFSV